MKPPGEGNGLGAGRGAVEIGAGSAEAGGDIVEKFANLPAASGLVSSLPRTLSPSMLGDAYLVQVALVVMKHEHVKCAQCTLQSHATVESLDVGGIRSEALGVVFLVFGPFFNGEAAMDAVEDGTRIVSRIRVSVQNTQSTPATVWTCCAQ